MRVTQNNTFNNNPKQFEYILSNHMYDALTPVLRTLPYTVLLGASLYKHSVSGGPW